MPINKNRTLVETKGILTGILIAILAFSLFLAFSQLDERGLLDWDEAYYLNVIKTWRAGVDWFFCKIFNPGVVGQFGFSDYILEHGGAINTFAKEGFLAFVFVFSYFTGLKATAILLVSGFFGVLTVWLVYLIGRLGVSKLAGCISAGILAISVYHLHYARSGFPQTTSVFFLYLAVLLYIFSYQRQNKDMASNRLLLFSGLSLGYAFSCHYNLFWSLPTFLFMELLNIKLSSGKLFFKKLSKRLSLFVIGFFVPIFIFGGISELIKFILSQNPDALEAISGSLGIGTYVTFFDRLLNFIKPAILGLSSKVQVASLMAREANPLFYIKLLFLWEGFVLLALLLIGVIHLALRQIRRRSFFEIAILLLFVVPLLVWSLRSWQLSRSFLAAIPAMALIVGTSIARLLERQFRSDIKKAAVIFVILLILGLQARDQIKKELNFKSGYPAAIKFMKENHGKKHLSSQFTISRFLVGRKNALDISVSFTNTEIKSRLRGLYNNQGYRYLLLDQLRFLFLDSPIVQAANRAIPVFVAPHSTEVNFFENDNPSFISRVKNSPEVLLVYDLNDIIDKINE